MILDMGQASGRKYQIKDVASKFHQDSHMETVSNGSIITKP